MNCAEVEEWLLENVTEGWEEPHCLKNRGASSTSDDSSLACDRLRELVCAHLEGCAHCREWKEILDDSWQMWSQSLPLTDQAEPKQSTPERSLPSRRRIPGTLYHYGLAASLTAALFYFGVFQHVLPNVLRISYTLSNHVAGAVVIAGHFLQKGNLR
jgi:predicted anti-sigma-YlaC factor YlaD